MHSHVESDLEEKYQMLQRQMEAMQLELQKSKMGKAQAMCSYCYNPDHLATECHMQPSRAEEANFMNAGWRRPEQQFNQGYNQNQRQHPGFQWSNPQGGRYAPTAPYQPPHMRQNQFQAPAQTATAPTKSIEYMFAAIMAKTDRQTEHYDQKLNNIQQTMN